MKRIGIPVSDSKTQHIINKAYIEWIVAAGYVPVLLAPGVHAKDNLNCIAGNINKLDGLLLPGGVDINTTYYGYSIIDGERVDSKKDEFERGLFRAAIEVGIPVFGVCRGLQLIFLEYILEHKTNLKFAQDIDGHNQVSENKIARNEPFHAIFAKPRLYGGLGDDVETIYVNSMHHQCVIKPNVKAQDADGFIVLATTPRRVTSVSFVSTKDKDEAVVIEAFDITKWKEQYCKIRAVQYHPEEMMDTKLLKAFFV